MTVKPTSLNSQNGIVQQVSGACTYANLTKFTLLNAALPPNTPIEFRALAIPFVLFIPEKWQAVTGIALCALRMNEYQEMRRREPQPRPFSSVPAARREETGQTPLRRNHTPGRGQHETTGYFAEGSPSPNHRRSTAVDEPTARARHIPAVGGPTSVYTGRHNVGQ